MYHSRHPADDDTILMWENEVMRRNGEGLLDILRQGAIAVPRFNVSSGYVTDWSQSVSTELVHELRNSPDATRNPWYNMRTMGYTIIV